MKVGIVGSRRRNTMSDFEEVKEAFLDLYITNKDVEIVSGGCPKGADRFAEILARQHLVPIKIFKPDWTQGRHAGFSRNTDIARESEVLIACVASDRKGGTEDTIMKFKAFHPEGKVILV